METLKQRRIYCYSCCGTQFYCYNCLDEIILLLYTLHLPFHVVFVNIPLISRFAPEIMLCRLHVLPYRLSIPDYRLLIHYYRFRILLYPLQTTVANPCLPSYNLTPSILFHQIPLRNIILSQLFLLTQDIDTAAQFSNLSTNSPLLQLFHFGASSSLDFSLAYFPSKFVPASIVADTTEKTTKTYCCRS